jgi:catechol 2,3-dioxygenase-like lactoylglutathione lyase family enzyme
VREYFAMTASISDFPIPREGILATHFVVAGDIAATTRFYGEQLGGEVVWSRDGMISFVKLANTWVIIAGGGGGTPDKPDVTLAPPDEHNRFDAFMNIRVADIDAIHREWSQRGVEFITPPLDNQGFEIRCYIRDPDGRIIEVGQHTGMLALWGLAEG